MSSQETSAVSVPPGVRWREWAYSCDGFQGDRTVSAVLQQLVLIALADVVDDQGQTCRGPSYLAQRIHKSERQIGRALAALDASGHISRFHQHDENGHRTSDLIVLAAAMGEDQ